MPYQVLASHHTVRRATKKTENADRFFIYTWPTPLPAVLLRQHACHYLRRYCSPRSHTAPPLTLLPSICNSCACSPGAYAAFNWTAAFAQRHASNAYAVSLRLLPPHATARQVCIPPAGATTAVFPAHCLPAGGRVPQAKAAIHSLRGCSTPFLSPRRWGTAATRL